MADGAPIAPGSTDRAAGSARSQAARRFAAGFVAYLVLAVTMWWHVWAGGVGSHATCICGDPGQTLWFLGWAPFAIAHGHNPFLSTWISSPAGVNLLANNSILLIGVLLAPLTWLAGPVVSLNVALTLTPALSAVAGMAVCRRFASTIPAWLGGLLFGFSPFVIGNLPYGHLSVSLLALPALVFLCLHELLVRQEGSPRRWGALLGGCLAAEFFVSTEMLSATILLTALGMAIVVGGALVVNPAAVAARARQATQGLLVAGAIALVVLVGPTWYAEGGPRHFSGEVWSFTAVFGNAWNGFFFVPPSATRPSSYAQFSGFAGPVGPPLAYFGFWLLAVLAAGAVAARRIRVVWFALTMATVASLLSLGATLLPFSWYSSWWTPWQPFSHLPLLENIGPQRFVGFAYLFAGILLAVILEHLWAFGRTEAVGSGAEVAPSNLVGTVPFAVAWNLDTHPGPRRRSLARLRMGEWATRHRAWREAVGGGLSALAAVGALVPLASSYSSVPYATTSAVPPRWFTTVAPTLRGSPTLLVLPYPGSREANAMAWQAIDGMTFRLVGAYAKVPGDNGHVQYIGAQGSADSALSLLSVDTGPEPDATAPTLQTVWQALGQWRISTVVLSTDTVRDIPYAAGFLTAVLGVAPVAQHGAWVWQSPQKAPGPLHLAPGALQACETQSGGSGGSVAATSICVLRAAAIS